MPHTESSWTNPDHVGFLPEIILADDPRPAREQFQDRYAHGGGWNPMNGWTLIQGQPAKLHYTPADEEYGADFYDEMSRTKINDETLILFESEWLAIVQPDGSFEVDRVD